MRTRAAVVVHLGTIRPRCWGNIGIHSCWIKPVALLIDDFFSNGLKRGGASVNPEAPRHHTIRQPHRDPFIVALRLLGIDFVLFTCFFRMASFFGAFIDPSDPISIPERPVSHCIDSNCVDGIKIS